MKKHRNMEGEEDLLDSIILLLKNFDYNCSYCKHFHEDHISCAAFPDVIPSPYLTGQVIHNKKRWGQKTNIFFEKAA